MGADEQWTADLLRRSDERIEVEEDLPRVGVQELLQELRALSLTETEARKAAFAALTWHRGWPTNRIGRYLGVSRVRVDQRIERLRRYTESKEMPLLSQLMADADRQPATGEELPIAFPAACWEDSEFALGMLQIVAGE